MFGQSDKITQKDIKWTILKTSLYVAYCRNIDYNYDMNTTTEKNCAIAIENSANRIAAEKLVLKCGVRADLKGCQCLVDAIIIFGTELCSGFCQIYKIIGELRGLRQKSVMREISYAISQAHDLPVHLSALIGIDIKEVHNGLVIAYLGRLFDTPELSAQNSANTHTPDPIPQHND